MVEETITEIKTVLYPCRVRQYRLGRSRYMHIQQHRQQKTVTALAPASTGTVVLIKK